MRYLDANIFLRYIARDQPEMTQAATRLFERLRRDEEEVTVAEITVAEVVFVLASRALYALPADQIRESLQFLLSIRSIRMGQKTRCLRALDLYAAHSFLNFGDAFLVAAMEDDGVPELYSYDRGFDRVEGIVRVEP